jgi:hypothetical protein
VIESKEDFYVRENNYQFILVALDGRRVHQPLMTSYALLRLMM